MTCRQVSTYGTAVGSGSPGGGGYATEAECLEACKEGACCEGATCTVKPQCQCQGAGQTFKGIGTTCSPNPCWCCSGGGVMQGTVSVAITRALDLIAGAGCTCGYLQPPPAEATRCVTETVAFSQTGQAEPCFRTVIADTPDGFTRTGAINANNQCNLTVNIDWPLNPCGGLVGGSVVRPYYSWPFVASQTSYSATYYSFFFIDGYGGNTAVSSTSTTVPQPPAHPQASSGRSYTYAGARWTIEMSVTFA